MKKSKEEVIDLNGPFARRLEKQLSKPFLKSSKEIEIAKKRLRERLRKKFPNDSEEEIEEEVEAIIKNWQEPILSS
jgi:hypothetical protein